MLGDTRHEGRRSRTVLRKMAAFIALTVGCNAATLARAQPAEERTYAFDIQNETYRQLVDEFSRQSEVGVIGDPPRRGRVDLVTAGELTFDEALRQIRNLLFAYKPNEPYWLLWHETHLEVLRFADLIDALPVERMFRNVEEFRAASLPSDDAAIVVFTPDAGLIPTLDIVSDFMPEYVRITAMEDRGALTILGLVRDIEKYLYLTDIFAGGGEDPRTLEIIDVEHILPSDALNKLERLTDLGTLGRRGAASRARSGRGRRASQRRGRARRIDPLDAVVEPETILLPNDERGVFVVRAMQDKIDEIRDLLPYIDVDTTVDLTPVIIELEHAEATEVAKSIQQILEASDAATLGRKVRSGRTGRGRSSRRPRRQKSPAFVSVGELSFMPHPAANAIVVMAEEDGVARIRQLVELLDVESRLGPVRIDLQHADANDIGATLMSIMNDRKRRGATPERIRVIPDPSGAAVWVSGHEHEVSTVRELISNMDMPEADSSLHFIDLTHQTPSFVADMLRRYDAATGQASATSRPQRTGRHKRARGRRTSPSRKSATSRFIPDDDTGRLFAICTDEDWEKYIPIIDELENAIDGEEPFVRLELEHIAPEVAIEKLDTLLFGNARRRDSQIRFASVDHGILAIGASASDIHDIEAILDEVDKATEIERRTFAIQHTDPAELMRTIQALVGDEAAARPKRGRQGRSRSRRAASRAATSMKDLTIVQVASQMVVRTTPAKMKRVAALIDELDVAQHDVELRVYDDFPPRTDIEGIADTISAVVNGTAQDSRTRRKRRNQPPPRVTLITQPASRRLIVRGAPAAFIQIEELLTALTGEQQLEDFEDLADATFLDVKHADTSELVEAIEPLVNLKVQEFIATGQLDDEPIHSVTRARRRAGRRSRSMNENQHYYMAPDIRNQRIVLAAPQIIVDHVTELLEEFDAPVDMPEDSNVSFIEVTHTDPAELVETIDPILGLKVQEFIAAGELDDKPIRSVTRARGRAGRRSRSTGESPYYYMEPDTRSRRIMFAGPQIVVDQAVELIERFDQPVDAPEDVDVTFVDVLHADPAELTEAVAPILGLKVREFIAAGQLDDEPIRPVTRARRRAGRRSGSTGENPYYYMAPDSRNRRIVLAATQVVLDEATRLIKQFDLPGDAERMIVRTVELTRADPAAIISSVGKILGAPTRGARRKRGQRSSQPGTVTTDSLSLRAAPGGGGLVLYGFSDEVDEAAGWIEELDALSSSDRAVNVYRIEHADVENLTDFIMSVVDSSGPGRGRQKTRRALQPLPEEDEFQTSRTWNGRDIYIQADLIGKVLVVAASQSKLSEIDEIVAQLDTEEASAVLNDTAVPKLLYELEHVDAFDAAFELEVVLDTLWEPSNERPTVDVGPFGNMLVIRYPDEARFSEIEELIAEYVDKPDPYGDRVTRRSFTVPRGMTAQEAVKRIREDHPELEIEVQGGLEAEDYGMERIRPRKAPNP